MRCKRLLAYLVVFVMAGMLYAGSAAAQDYGLAKSGTKFGLGYQGTWIQGLFNGVSARVWLDDALGMEGNLFMGSIDGDQSLYILEGKFMYAPVVRENSRFYFGGLLNLAIYDVNGADGTVIGLGPMFGTEWHYKELPEIGFNFDVGLKYFNDTGDIDMDVWAIDVTWGIHYYF